MGLVVRCRLGAGWAAAGPFLHAAVPVFLGSGRQHQTTHPGSGLRQALGCRNQRLGGRGLSWEKALHWEFYHLQNWGRGNGLILQS